MSRVRRTFAVLAALAGVAAFAPAAQAGVLVASAGECEEETASQVFLPWMDVANYVPAPGYRAESGKRWNLDGASIVDGNEPWHVVSEKDSHSLSIPSGASATTDAMCVGLTHPTLRFFVKQTDGSALRGGLDVTVHFEDATGGVQTMYIGTADGYGWHPSNAMVITASLLPLLPFEKTPVSFTFTARGGDFQIDDVHVDPWARH
jgi:hypothetical protein